MIQIMKIVKALEMTAKSLVMKENSRETRLKQF